MSDQTTQQNAQHEHHVTPFMTYIWVAVALFTLTIITVSVAQIDFGPWNLVVAMLVASAKAILVALFFMHLMHDNKLYGALFSGSLLFLSIFIILTLFDTMGRGDVAVEEAGPIQQRAVIYGEDGKPLKSSSHGEAERSEGAAESEDVEHSEDASESSMEEKAAAASEAAKSPVGSGH